MPKLLLVAGNTIMLRADKDDYDDDDDDDDGLNRRHEQAC